MLPAVLVANSPEYLVMPEPLASSSYTSSNLAPTWASPSPPGKTQEQTLVEDPHPNVEVNSQLKPMGSVTKEEDSKTLPPVVQLHIKNTHSNRQIMCLWNI